MQAYLSPVFSQSDHSEKATGSIDSYNNDKMYMHMLLIYIFYQIILLLLTKL